MDNELKFTVKSESHDPVCPFSAAGTGVCEFSMAASGTTLGMADLFSSSFFFFKAASDSGLFEPYFKSES